jgi:hypothetical protein
MNLRWVHAVLIMLSAALAVVFGIWCLAAYSRGEGQGNLVAAVVSLGVSFGLVLYDSWFLRKTRSMR